MVLQDRQQENGGGRDGREDDARDGRVLVRGCQVRIASTAELGRLLSLPHVSTSLRCAVWCVHILSA